MAKEEGNREEQKAEGRKEDAASQPEPAPVAESCAIEVTAMKSETGAEPAPVAKAEEPELVRAAYEHPLAIRVTHWVNAISLFVMVTSGCS